MFSAKAQDGKVVNLLEESSQIQDKEVRSLSNSGFLNCPECGTKVVAKLGRIRRPHFAHSVKNDCPYGNESVELLDARALLFKALTRRFGDCVSVEVRTSSDLPRGVDCHVDRGNFVFDYWILDRRIKVELRERLSKLQEQSPHKFNILFVGRMLESRGTDTSQIRLSTTERETMFRGSLFNFKRGASLHYLDVANVELTTFRDLRVTHGGGIARGECRQTNLGEIDFVAKTGEPFHPGEREMYLAFESERKKQEAETARIQTLMYGQQSSVQKFETHHREGYTDDLIGFGSLFSKEGTCRYCGTLTTDWQEYDGNTGLCTCARCHRIRTGRGVEQDYP